MQSQWILKWFCRRIMFKIYNGWLLNETRTMHSRLSMFWIIHRLINIKLRKVIALSSCVIQNDGRNEQTNERTPLPLLVAHFQLFVLLLNAKMLYRVFIYLLLLLLFFLNGEIETNIRLFAMLCANDQTEMTIHSMKTFKQILVFLHFRP